MLDRLVSFVKGLFRRKTWSMAIVRRYADANGSYVGELYLLGTFFGILQYSQIGMSLDTLPLELAHADWGEYTLDCRNDFLAVMPALTVRIGAQDPTDTAQVREHVARLAKTGRISLQVSNRFVEHVMGKK